MMAFLWIVAVIILLFGFVVFRGAPYVPSKKRELEKAFTELYPLKKDDVLVDIGSGDGVVLRQAAKCGARAVGYELNPLLVLISRWLCRHQPAIHVQLADFWFVSLPDNTTVVYVFGESRDIAKMAKKVASEATRLNRPISFISYGFAVAGETIVRTVGAHHLYRFEPLHRQEA
jgi:hypothetical protein